MAAIALLLFGNIRADAQTPADLPLSREAATSSRLITKAIEVRSLSVVEAESGIDARLRGTVIFIEGTSAIFLQDETSTTFFRRRSDTSLPRVGDEVEISGKTRMGLYQPGLDYCSYTVLGQRPLPPGIPARYDDLVFSRYHYQRVAVEGVVRSVQPLEPKRSFLRLAMGANILDVRVEVPPEAGRSLVDYRVRITGLAAGLLNPTRRLLVQPYVRVIDWSEIEILEAAPPAPQVPAVSADELLAFRVDGHGEQRVRIQGTITAAFNGGTQLFLRDGTFAFGARLSAPTELVVGDEVTLVGFPTMDRFSAAVVDAECVERRSSQISPPIAVASLDQLFGRAGDTSPGKYDGDLVTVTGVLRDSFKIEGGTALLLQGGTRTLQAKIPEDFEAPPAGSQLQLTGICQVESAVMGSGFASRPGIISLRARSAADLVVLRAPSWWTPRRLTTVLAALFGVTLLAAIWITVLRRQVSRQTAALRHRIEAEAALEERQRIAREFHDTLEQELAGVSLRLDALATRNIDDKGRALVQGSRNLVSRIQGETRNLISDLRDPAEAAGDLSTALNAIAVQLSADHGAEIQVVSTAPVQILPARTVHDLRMMARESVNNALKHGGATRITIQLAPSHEKLVLTVVDNGRGFDPAAATVQVKRGHFGCAGIRERARKLGATVEWRSTPGTGATVEIVLPLSSAKSATPAASALSDSLSRPCDTAAPYPNPQSAV